MALLSAFQPFCPTLPVLFVSCFARVELHVSYIVLCGCLCSIAQEPISLHHLVQFWWNLWGFCHTLSDIPLLFPPFPPSRGPLLQLCSGCGPGFPAAAEFPAMPCPLVVCCWPSQVYLSLLLHHWKTKNCLLTPQSCSWRAGVAKCCSPRCPCQQ